MQMQNHFQCIMTFISCHDNVRHTSFIDDYFSDLFFYENYSIHLIFFVSVDIELGFLCYRLTQFSSPF